MKEKKEELSHIDKWAVEAQAYAPSNYVPDNIIKENDVLTSANDGLTIASAVLGALLGVLFVADVSYTIYMVR